MSKRDESIFYIPGEVVPHPDRDTGMWTGSPGLTKRELFAAIALQGLISGCYAGNNSGFTVQGNCVGALEYADALIEALEEGK